jgi:hypothetical protein
MAYLAAYISCVEETEGLPSSQDVDMHPIIDSLQHTNLQRFVCRPGHNGYFGLRHNRDYFIRQVINGSIQAQTLAVITELDASRLTGYGRRVCSDTEMTSLAHSISRMHNLCYLDIRYNVIEPGSQFPVSLRDSLAQCTQLQQLRMNGMDGITRDCIGTIMHALPNLSLRVLHIGANPLPDVNGAACLGQCHSLQELSASYMKEDDTASGQMNAFIDALDNLHNLTKLDLWHIRFTEEQLQRIVDICRKGKMEELW